MAKLFADEARVNSENSRLEATDQQLYSSPSKFGTALFRELSTEAPEGTNVLYSPLSVYQAIALAKEGATAGSRNEREMEQLLGSSSVQAEALKLQHQAETGDPDADVQLVMATSVWTNDLRKSYMETAKQKYSSEAEPLPTTYAPVDVWIGEKTNGMIPRMMGNDKLDPLTVALLVNAVYFKGAWTYAFDPDDTVTESFTKSNGTSVKAKFMVSLRDLNMIPSSRLLKGSTVVVLDYGEESSTQNPEFSSMFILPEENQSMDEVISLLDSKPISELLAEVNDVKAVGGAILKLPRFKLEYTTKLKPSLERMGMITAFDKTPATDGKFKEMSDDPAVYIEDVHHKAYMEVTEQGTKAAAATLVEIRTRSITRTPRITFNRPFLAIVMHWPTGIPVFIGRVEDPEFI